MKAIFYTDAHIHAHQFGAGVSAKTGRQSRLQDGLDVLDMTHKAVIDHKAVARFFIGDMTHVRGTMKPSIINPILDHHVMAHQSKRHEFDDFLLVGNHDMEHRTEGEHSLHLLQGDEVFVYEDHGYECRDYMWEKEGEMDEQMSIGIGWVAYEPNIARLKEKVAAVAAMCESERKEYSDGQTSRSDCDIFILHHGVDGAMPNIPEMGFGPLDLPHNTFDMMFCGDYHSHKELIPGKAWMVGAPMQHTFGDAGQKRGYMVVDLAAKTAEFVESTAAPKFITCEKLKSGAEIWSDSEINEGDFIRLRSDDEDWLKSKEAQLLDIKVAAVKREFIHNFELTAKSDVSLSMTTEQMFGAWTKKQTFDEGIDEAELIALNNEILREVGV